MNKFTTLMVGDPGLNEALEGGLKPGITFINGKYSPVRQRFF